MILIGGMCSVNLPPSGTPCADKSGNVDVWRLSTVSATTFSWSQARECPLSGVAFCRCSASPRLALTPAIAPCRQNGK